METTVSPNGKTVATKLAPMSGTTPAPAMPVRQRKRQITRLYGGRSTVNLTVNFPAYPAAQPAPAVQPHGWPDGALIAVAMAAGALIVALTLLAGLYLYNLPPVTPIIGAAVSAPAPIVRTSGTVDISSVSANDMGIDWFNPVNPGVYRLRQNSTGMFITDGGNTVLVDGSGARIFR